ncbi:MAG: hypothetical protein OEX11_10740 [Nitrosomonas sp.]|nr:hypothetical protein [Nitrosomonas sp.]MDH5730675.1 hypothetical protein [Gammaproteobacteria bacterium]
MASILKFIDRVGKRGQFPFLGFMLCKNQVAALWRSKLELAAMGL